MNCLEHSICISLVQTLMLNFAVSCHNQKVEFKECWPNFFFSYHKKILDFNSFCTQQTQNAFLSQAEYSWISKSEFLIRYPSVILYPLCPMQSKFWTSVFEVLWGNFGLQYLRWPFLFYVHTIKFSRPMSPLMIKFILTSIFEPLYFLRSCSIFD